MADGCSALGCGLKMHTAPFVLQKHHIVLQLVCFSLSAGANDFQLVADSNILTIIDLQAFFTSKAAPLLSLSFSIFENFMSVDCATTQQE